MQLNEKQKRAIWIVAVVLVVIHFAPGVYARLNHAWESRNPPSHTVKPSPYPIAPAVPSVAVPVAPPSPDAAFIPLIGTWRGNAIMPNNEMCAVSLELKKSEDKPGNFTGFSTQNCGPAIPLLGHQYTPKSLPPDLLRTLAPVSTILSGTVENGEMHLQLPKSITTDPKGCEPTSYRLTPFAEGLGTTFERGQCAEGKLVMRKVTR